MQNNNFLSKEGFLQLNQAINKILTSFNDLKNVVEEIIPEELSNKGLRHCLLLLCQEIEKDEKIEIIVKEKWEENPMDIKFELNLYKIFNALITLIISQKRTSPINVIIEQTDKIFTFSLLFNSKNFSLTGIPSSEIKKIAHIKSLIESLNGNFIMQQKKDNITEISVAIGFE